MIVCHSAYHVSCIAGTGDMVPSIIFGWIVKGFGPMDYRLAQEPT